MLKNEAKGIKIIIKMLTKNIYLIK